jgi:LuxR family quorum sensing-dependent transcriptional regulator
MAVAQFTFDRIEAIESASTPSAVLLEIQRTAADFGLSCFMTGFVPAPHKPFEPYILLHNWPLAWFKRYMDNAYMDIDPVIRKTRNTFEPFAWSEAAYDRGKDPLAHKVMCEATEFRLRAGYTVPLFTRSGDQGGMTFGGERFEASPDAKKALHLIAIYGHGKARAIAMARQRTVVATPKLSAREIEVLKWCAAGKTNSAIADILLVSATTIETHIARACRKLDCMNRTHAVAEAMRARLIF